MIRKIQSSEYLKRYDNMSAEERTAYENRVGEWLRDNAPMLKEKSENSDARLHDIVNISTRFNDRECKAFEEGAMLLSALQNRCETWLPDMLYIKAAGRCIKRMIGLLDDIMSEICITRAKRGDNLPSGGTEHLASLKRTPPAQMLEDQFSRIVNNDKQVSQNAKLSKQSVNTNIPVRPTHIDQYVHLLPKKTQERAANYGPLMRELDEMREKQRLLMDADGVSAKDREAVAKRIVSIDKEIGGIRKELDAEWEKLVKQGRVVVDDLGMAHVVSEEGKKQNSKNSSQAGHGQTQPQDKARRREIRKWLVDTRRGNGDTREKHVKEWKKNFREFVGFDGDKAFKDKKVIEAAKFYGIKVEELKK